MWDYLTLSVSQEAANCYQMNFSMVLPMLLLAPGIKARNFGGGVISSSRMLDRG